MKSVKYSLLFLFLLGALTLSAQDASNAQGPGPPGSGPGPPGSGPGGGTGTPPREPVPEPATAALVGIGALGVYGYKKLRDKFNQTP